MVLKHTGGHDAFQPIFAVIAQVVERQVEALRVVGPTPTRGTKPLAGYFPKRPIVTVATADMGPYLVVNVLH